MSRIRKPEKSLVERILTPDELYEQQRKNALPEAEKCANSLMYQLQHQFRPDTKSFRYTIPEIQGNEIIVDLIMEALLSKGWNVKYDKGSLIIERAGEDEQPWYGTLKFSRSGDVHSLMVVKSNADMDEGYDVVSHVTVAGYMGQPEEVYVLDPEQGWLWIGRLSNVHAHDISLEEQAIDLLKTYNESVP